MLSTLKHILVFCCACLISICLSANDAKDTTAVDSRLAKALQSTDQLFRERQEKDSTLKLIEQLAHSDTALKRQLYSYYEFGMQHRRRTFEWNLISSKITFWVVIVLVFSGIVFAALQFYISIRERKTRADKGVADLQTELEANLKGVKISSPVLGVIILIISLLFFYLYLAYVYPIQETF